MVMDAAETDFFERQAKRLANLAAVMEQQQIISKPVRIPEQAPQQVIKFPKCYPCHYQGDCKDCSKPLIQKVPNGPLNPCEGSIVWCQFAQGSTRWNACTRFSIENYACTHQGGTCEGCAIKWRKYI